MKYIVLVQYRGTERTERELESEHEAIKWAGHFPQDIVMAVEPEPDYKSILQMYMFHIFNHCDTLYLYPGDREVPSVGIPNVLDNQSWDELKKLEKQVMKWANPLPAYFVIYHGDRRVIMLPHWSEEDARELAGVSVHNIVFEADLHDMA